MISKPFSAPEPASDPRLRAGWEAEADMAHLLDRHFGSAKDIYLFHGLRFPTHLANDAAQIDHLVLYRHGIAIIESKSVSGELRVDALGQWQRHWRTRSGRSGRSGVDNIPDPLLQAKRQAEALRAHLNSTQPPLMDKMVGFLQKSFRNFPIIPYVGISTNGRFVGYVKTLTDSVMKADRITAELDKQIAYHRRGSGVLGLLLQKDEDVTVFNLNHDELSRIVAFLLKSHTPLPSAALPPRATPAPASPPPATPIAPPTPPRAAPPTNTRTTKLDNLFCTKCGETARLEVVYRKDYCILCHACSKYTALGRACTCGRPATIHKDGPSFFRDCDTTQGGCGKQITFWINPKPI